MTRICRLDIARDPAMEAGLAHHVWTIEELVGLLEA
jgi:hypothetical protein